MCGSHGIYCRGCFFYWIYLEPMKWLRRIFLSAVIVVAVILVAINIWLSAATHTRRYNSIAQVPHNKIGLLLGTAKYDTTTNKLLEYYTQRVNAAIQLYRAGKIKYILVSSINTAKERNTDDIVQDLIAAGIPANRIWVDEYGLRTYDSILRCNKLLSGDSITIITQKHHGQRALLIADHAGMQAIAYTAPGSDEIFPGAIFHEQAARLIMLYDLATHRRSSFMADKPIVKLR